MSDGSSFAGSLGATPADTVAISGTTRLVLARALTQADDGPQQWAVTATQNGVTVSASITVRVLALSPPPPPPPPPPSGPAGITESPNPVAINAAVTVTVAGGPGNLTDWVGLASSGSPDTSFLSGWQYLNGATSATLHFTAPATGGNYEARFYVNNSFTVIARTTFVVAAPQIASIFPTLFSGGNGTNLLLIRSTSPVQNGNAVAGSGTFTFSGGWFNNGAPYVAPANGTVTAQMLVDNEPVGNYMIGPPFNWTWDSTTVTDGTHYISLRFIDSTGSWNTGTLAYCLRAVGTNVIVQNRGAKGGMQVVPSGDRAYNGRMWSSMCDFVTYPGTPPHNTVTPWPGGSIAPSSDPALRNPAMWFRESLTEPRFAEYESSPQFYTTQKGGVFATGYIAQYSIGLEAVYVGVIRHNNMDGGRNDNMVDPYSNVIGAPDGRWTGVDVAGRVFNVNQHTGETITLVGPQRNRNVLPLDYDDFSTTEGQVFAPTNAIGRIVPNNAGAIFGDFHGANDVCYDPRNPSIIYVAKTLDHIIYKADVSQNPPVCTVHAGQDGISGNVDGPASSALFNKPYSICMAADGTMYVADNGNDKVRKISPDGLTVSTLAGQFTIPNAATIQANTIFNITSMSWSTGTATLVVDRPTGVVGVGDIVAIIGAANGGTGTSALVTGGFVVNGFTDSQHFSVAMPAAAGSIAPPFGSPQLNAVGIYSSALPIPLATAYFVLPQTVRMTSGGDLLVGEAWSQTVRRIHLSTGLVSRIGSFGNWPLSTVSTFPDGSPGSGWAWMDVDTKGNCGPVDDIIFFKSDSDPGEASTIWRLSLDGTYSANFSGDSGFLPVGDYTGGGHYPWVVAFSKTEGRIFTMGFGDTGVFSWHIKQPSDPAIDPLNNIGVDWEGPTSGTLGAYRRGQAIWDLGTLSNFPWGSRPSFRFLRGPSGVGHLGVFSTVDELNANYPTDDTLAAYIQGGMGGTVPRPEITGNDLRDLIYWNRRTSAAGGYISIVSPGSDQTDFTAPAITNIVATRLSTTSIEVTWTTDKPTYGFVAAGSPNSAGTPAPYNCWQLEPWNGSAEASYTTSHSLILSGLPTTAPTHYVVLSKDIAGNSSVSSDATI